MLEDGTKARSEDTSAREVPRCTDEIIFDKLVGEKQHPDWVRDAKLRPILQEAGLQLLAFLPTDPAFLERLKPAAPEAPGAAPPTPEKADPNAAPAQ